MFGADRRRIRTPGPTQCHDITVYPAIGLAGGACDGYGLLLDIQRSGASRCASPPSSDSNFSYWHSATFNNDGTKILFCDEWGGGGQPKCRATDKHEWGADAIFTIDNDKMQFQSYYKLPAPQTHSRELRRAQRLARPDPRPRRDDSVVVSGRHVALRLDRCRASEGDRVLRSRTGGLDAHGERRIVVGVLVQRRDGELRDLARARHLELTPSAFISQNEIDAAKSVKWDYLNTQGQRKIVWPPSFALSRAYLDQLERSHGLAADKIAADRAALKSAEKASGSARSAALTQLATQIDADASGSSDGAKVQKLSESVKALAGAQ